MTRKKLKKKIAELEDKLRSAHIEHRAKHERWHIDLCGAKETADKAVKLAEEKTKEADEWKAKYLVGLMQNIELAERIKADNEQRAD